MNKDSRRALARWAADQLIAGKSASLVARHLAAVLIESKMSNQAEFLLNDILWELEQTGVLAHAKVTSAQPLSRQLEEALKIKLKKAAGTNQIMLETQADKAVIGG